MNLVVYAHHITTHTTCSKLHTCLFHQLVAKSVDGGNSWEAKLEIPYTYYGYINVGPQSIIVSVPGEYPLFKSFISFDSANSFKELKSVSVVRVV